MRVLFATSECSPWVKTGGLGDVAASLTARLQRDGCDVRVLMPAYRDVRNAIASTNFASIPATATLPGATIRKATLPSGVVAWLVDSPTLFDREGGPYQDGKGLDFPDNACRFALLSHIAATLSSATTPIEWRPHILHLNDWQTAPAAALLAQSTEARAATLVTIHNLAFQGVFDGDLTGMLGLPPQAFGIDGVEFHGKTSYLKAGLIYADALSTVSPTYAHEIQRAPLGFGLEGVLAMRARQLTGILNGIDEVTWDPASDPLLFARYDAANIGGKRENKRALQCAMGLAERADVPLFGIVSRLTWQKGTDLALALVDRLVARPAQLVVLGSGERDFEQRFAASARAHPRSVGVRIGFDEPLAHRIEAGADAFLMPSRFEPCGLNQMYSQRYATPPIAHATGGLCDSIVDATPEALASGRATGFLFRQPTADALNDALDRAIDVYMQPDRWRAMMRAGMTTPFGWARSAQDYIALYRSLVAKAASLSDLPPTPLDAARKRRLPRRARRAT
ncbi:MAG TPA: glycogen synthase GlgA [Casimicrobiaceae bacterium]|nr:glycogen synthase GlgA [Casimicrobiaceae bacterium]